MNRQDWYQRKFIGKRRLSRKCYGQSSYIRRLANKKIRKFKDDIQNGRWFSKISMYDNLCG